MSEHTIQIEGLPEGFEVVGVSIHPSERNDDPDWLPATVKLRKTKPRRIVLEEISKEEFMRNTNERFHRFNDKWWREIKEE